MTIQKSILCALRKTKFVVVHVDADRNNIEVGQEEGSAVDASQVPNQTKLS